MPEILSTAQTEKNI